MALPLSAGLPSSIRDRRFSPAGAPQWPSDADVAAYEAALESLIAGRWDEAFERLHQVPSTDRAKDFLTVTILQHGRVPPPNWDGVIDIGKGG